ncbi:MAG: SDR family oxidoreductase [Cyclobacteriaceae bacterium]|nr:SDR family oxidoreductase [Cyclobacteriaceae bacterium HetDA_MAG_MS6]
MNNPFDISQKIAVVTGGSGVLGGAIAQHFVESGAKVCILGRSGDKVKSTVSSLSETGQAIGFACDVLDEQHLREVKNEVVQEFGSIDFLINAAGGNIPGASVGPDQTIFDLHIEDFKKVTDLNFTGTVLPSLVFGEAMTQKGTGSIVNYSSMAATQAISRGVGYSAAKSAVENFTRWMAMEMALKFGDGIRVNAVSPGFFITHQNRALLTKEDGSFTERAQTVINKTPMRRFGKAHELNGAIHWLCSPAASFVTGAVIPVDGGFGSYSGV